MESTGGYRETCGMVNISGSLKVKILLLENAIAKVRDEVKFQKKEVQILQSEKDTLEKVLEQKSIDLRTSIESEVSRWDSNLRSQFKQAKSENNQIQQEISVLKHEKTTLQQTVLLLQRKISELELIVGHQREEK